MKNGEKVMLIALIILAVLVVLAIAAGFFFASSSMSIRRQTLDEARKWQEDHYDLSWYDPLEKTEYQVTSYDGYVLNAELISNPIPADKYVLLSHGYTDNRFGSLKYTKMYLDLGFNVIVYDLRGHGENEPTFCTYSVRERKDLIALIRDCRDRYQPAVLGIHGESLGAATSIACLEDKPQIDFVVADCGFSDISNVLKGGVKSMHLPEGLVPLASVCARLRYGYSYDMMRPIDSLADNEIPILFIHGAEDSFILPENSERMEKETKGYSELHLIPGAAHAASVLTAPEEYQEIVEAFLAHINTIKPAMM